LLRLRVCLRKKLSSISCLLNQHIMLKEDEIMDISESFDSLMQRVVDVFYGFEDKYNLTKFVMVSWYIWKKMNL